MTKNMLINKISEHKITMLIRDFWEYDRKK